MNCGRHLILVVSAFVVTSAHIVPARPMKGMRAILFHGPSMPDIVRVTGLESANALYTTITKAMHSGPRYNKESLNGRPCIAIDAVRAASAPYMSDAALVPYYADHRYWFYPAVNDRPAVFMTGHEVPNHVLKIFEDAGVPVQLTSTAAGQCEWEK